MNNFKKLLCLSAKNVFGHKWLYARMAIAFACITFLICLFSAFSVSFAVMQNEMKNDYVSANYIISREEIPELKDRCESFTVDRYALSSLVNDKLGYYTSILAFHIAIEVDETEYKCIDSEDMSFNGVDVYMGDKFVSKNDLTELEKRFKGVSPITGRMPETSFEALVCDEFLNWYGLNGEDVLGKKFNLAFVNGEERFTFLQDITICGIICKEYFKLKGHEVLELQPSVLLKDEFALLEGDKYIRTNYVYNFSEWLTEEEGDAYEEKFACSYEGDWVLSDIQLIKDIRHIATNLFLIVGLTLGGGILLMVFLMTEKLIAVFSRDGGIFLTCGMEKKELNKLLYIILLWVCLFAFILAAVLTVIAFYAINALISSFYHITIELSFPVIAILFAAGIVAVLIMASAYYLYSICQMRKRTIKELLTTQI